MTSKHRSITGNSKSTNFRGKKANSIRKSLRFEPAYANSLQLDIDRRDALKHFHKTIRTAIVVLDEIGIRVTSIGQWRSRSGRGWHIVIRLSQRLKIFQRIALQAILGSDRIRELCNLRRAILRDPYPIVFFEADDAEKKETRR